MREKWILAMVFVLSAQLGTVRAEDAQSDTVWLARDGVAQGHLFLPRTVGRPLLLAGEELRTYFRKMTGAELPLAWRGPDLRHRRDTGIENVIAVRGYDSFGAGGIWRPCALHTD